MVTIWSLTKQTKENSDFVLFLNAEFANPNFLKDNNCYLAHLSVLNDRKLYYILLLWPTGVTDSSLFSKMLNL